MSKNSKHSNQAVEELPLIAIDMGSDNFKLMAAEQLAPNEGECSPIRILACETSQKNKCVSKGIIQNASEASYMIRESMLLMSNKLQRTEPLPAAVALTGGKSLRCVNVRAKRSLGIRSSVLRPLLDAMEEECLMKVNRTQNGTSIVGLDVRPACFNLDGEESQEEPAVGTQALMIEGTYSTFYGSPELKDKVQGAFDRAGKSIEKLLARPSAHVEALVSEEDELTGVAIIDMGAETTTISIYKGGRFLTCKVVPQGGHNITKDIEFLGISEANAEKLKLKFGSAFEINEKDSVTIRIKPLKEGDEPVMVKTDFLSHIIVSRLEETMSSIFNELHAFEDQITTVYLTGGASKIKNIIPYVQAHTPLKVMYGSHADWLSLDTDPQFYGPEYSALVGALIMAVKYRVKNPGKALPEPPIKGIKDRIKKVGNMLEDMFTNNQ